MATRADNWFCSATCRFQFHKLNNTGFGRVREIFDKQMRAHLKEFAKLQERVANLEACAKKEKKVSAYGF
jgi:hypothetical protein